MAQVLMTAAYAASALTLVALAGAIVRAGRPTPARATLLALIVSTLIWTAESVWRLIAEPSDPTLAVAWAMPIAAVTVATVRMIVRSASDAFWRASPLMLITFSVHPVATVIAASTPSLRDLVLIANADGTFSYGPIFWVHLVASYMLLSTAAFEMFSARAHIPFLAKHLPATMIIAWAVPVTLNLLRTFLGQPGTADITPIGLTLTAGVLYIMVMRGGFADLAPIARAKVFEDFVDAVFVVDVRGTLVDTNAKARSLADLPEGGPTSFGISLADAWPAIALATYTPGEHDVVCHGVAAILDIAVTDLTDQSGRLIGRAIRARDVTQPTLLRRELARMHNQLAREADSNEELRAKLVDQASRDVGTGLYNRRYIMESLPGIVEQCEKDGLPLSVVMIDLDHFKDINDTWGHSVGDRVLAAVAKAMQSAAPPGLMARFGGEEFLAVLPGMATAEAAAGADAIRAACAAVEVRTREGFITLTASAGVATAKASNIDAFALIDAADAALYLAKESSRDRTWVADEDGLPL